MDTTVRSADEPTPALGPPTWTLVIAHHPDPAMVGRWAAILDGAELDVSRGGAALGDRALEHATLSRAHARFTAAGGQLRVEDLGSRNGTRVGGAPATDAPLAPGDVVEIGDVLLLVVRPARPPRAIDDAGVVGASGALAEVVDELRATAARTGVLLLVGETGTGKSVLARAVHAWSGRAALVVLPCASVAAELAARELHGVAAGAFPGAAERAGLLAGADGGTLVLDDLDDAPPAVQAALHAFLDDRMLRPIGAAARAIDVRVIATARGTAALRPELASHVEAFAVRVPPLRDRLEDVPVLARAAFARAGRAPSKRLALALLRHPWPHNVRELEAVIERAIAATPAGEPVPLAPAIAAHLGAADPAPPAELVAAADGSWMRVRGGERINLRRRENLGRLLQALVAARRDRPGEPLSIDDLFEVGWPGERVAARSAAGRVYVALTALRNLGLRELLRRDDDGYAIDPAVRVEIVA